MKKSILFLVVPIIFCLHSACTGDGADTSKTTGSSQTDKEKAKAVQMTPPPTSREEVKTATQEMAAKQLTVIKKRAGQLAESFCNCKTTKNKEACENKVTNQFKVVAERLPQAQQKDFKSAFELGKKGCR